MNAMDEMEFLDGRREAFAARRSAFRMRLREQLAQRGLRLESAAFGSASGQGVWSVTIFLPSHAIASVEALIDPALDPDPLSIHCADDVAHRIWNHFRRVRRLECTDPDA